MSCISRALLEAVDVELRRKGRIMIVVPAASSLCFGLGSPSDGRVPIIWPDELPEGHRNSIEFAANDFPPL